MMFARLRGKQSDAAASAGCRVCAHFDNDPRRMEQAIRGLLSFGSGHASVRADDGVCCRHDRYVRANYSCGDFRRGE